MFREKKNNETIADLVKTARKEKGLSARKLATLLNVSHTEINNIESGIRVKPSIIVLKGIEQYLDVPFSITAKLAGYSDETVKYGEEEIENEPRKKETPKKKESTKKEKEEIELL